MMRVATVNIELDILAIIVDLSGYAVANLTYAMGVAKSVNREMKDAWGIS